MPPSPSHGDKSHKTSNSKQINLLQKGRPKISNEMKIFERLVVARLFLRFITKTALSTELSISKLYFFLLSFQILQVKVRRLEHLLHLKNLRIDDLTSKLNGNQRISPTHQISPQSLQQNFASQGHHPQNLPPSVPPLKQHPPLPGISSKPGVSRHYGYP